MMYLSYNKMMVFYVYLLVLLMGVMSMSWFFIWVVFEVTLLMYMCMYKKLSQSLLNSLMKYFIIQGLSSNLFFMGLLLMKLIFMDMSVFLWVIFMAMWMSVGFFPFSSWYFQMSENLDWGLWLILNSMQKLIPMWIMSMVCLNLIYVNLIIIVNSIYSGVEICVQISLRWLMNCSSMNHFMWLLVSQSVDTIYWQLYFLVYSLMMLMLYWSLKNKMLNSYFNFIVLDLMSIFYVSLLMFNFMGMPPFIGFLPKIMVLKVVNFYILMAILLMSNLLSAVMYMYIISSLVVLKINKFNLLKFNFNFYMMCVFMLNFLFYLFVIFNY